MRRFQAGQAVFINRFMGEDCQPPRSGVVREIYGASSLLFDYLIQVGERHFPMRDEWLVPVSITISEAAEYEDVQSS